MSTSAEGQQQGETPLDAAAAQSPLDWPEDTERTAGKSTAISADGRGGEDVSGDEFEGDDSNRGDAGDVGAIGIGGDQTVGDGEGDQPIFPGVPPIIAGRGTQ
jgi:hypothetical protein